MVVQKIVNGDLLIPVGLAIMVIGGAATWMSSVRSDLLRHENQIEILATNQESHTKLVMEINSRLSRIEWSLEQRKGK